MKTSLSTQHVIIEFSLGKYLKNLHETFPLTNSKSPSFVCKFLLTFYTGFCGETEEEFADTLSVMSQVKYHMAFMFAYSMREVSWSSKMFFFCLCVCMFFFVVERKFVVQTNKSIKFR